MCVYDNELVLMLSHFWIVVLVIVNWVLNGFFGSLCLVMLLRGAFKEVCMV